MHLLVVYVKPGRLKTPTRPSDNPRPDPALSSPSRSTTPRGSTPPRLPVLQRRLFRTLSLSPDCQQRRRRGHASPRLLPENPPRWRTSRPKDIQGPADLSLSFSLCRSKPTESSATRNQATPFYFLSPLSPPLRATTEKR